MRVLALARAIGLLIGLVVVVAACGGAPAGPSANTPDAAPSATVGTSPAPVASSPAPRPSESPLTGALTIYSRDFAFALLKLEVMAGEPFTIVHKNADGPGVLHDLDILAKDKTTVIVDQEIIDGGETAEYEYPMLEAGEYVFICSVHPIPAMTGKLTVL